MGIQKKDWKQVRRIFLALLFCILIAVPAAAERPLHRIGAEYRPGFVPPTHAFLSGENWSGEPIDRSRSFHLKYAFQRPQDRFAPTAYQGVGLSGHTFFNDRELGAPVSIYLLQGARLARLGPRLALNYEWNFGLSLGWSAFDYDHNSFNLVIGSRTSAYLNPDFYFAYRLSRALDLTAGLSISHFSNGNTALPNAGLNTVGATLGVVCHPGRTELYEPPNIYEYTDFQRGIYYDAMIYGAWRKKIVRVDDLLYAAPKTYGVTGFNAGAMYALSRKLSVGASLDGVWDSSANVYAEPLTTPTDGNGIPYAFVSPAWYRQCALGVATRVDYAMPLFTISFGLGANVLHGGGDMKGFYQKLVLKTALSPRTFLHIGYTLRQFNTPSHLMLGLGMRFN